MNRRAVARLVLAPAAKATAAVWFSVAAVATANSSFGATVTPAQSGSALSSRPEDQPEPGSTIWTWTQPLTTLAEPPSTEVVSTVANGGDSGSLVNNGAPAPFGVTSVVSLTGSGIPVRVYQAYVKAQDLAARDHPACHLPWSLLAGIGRLESNHGRFGGAVVGPDGRVAPPIFGPLLDGHLPGTAVVHDSDHGLYDGSTTWDRAVGPMQFLPQSWRTSGADANGDGLRDPQQIDDAAYAAALYLCTGGGDLSTFASQYAAVFRYNHSDSYVRLVLSLAATYASGQATAVPDTIPDGGHAGATDPPADAGGPPLGLSGDGLATVEAPQTTTTPVPTTTPAASGDPSSTTLASSTTTTTATTTTATPPPATTAQSTSTTAAPTTTTTGPATTTTTAAPTTTTTAPATTTTAAPATTAAPTTTTQATSPSTTAQPTSGTALQTPTS